MIEVGIVLSDQNQEDDKDHRNYQLRFDIASTLFRCRLLQFETRTHATIGSGAIKSATASMSPWEFNETDFDLEKQLIFDHGVITFELGRANKSLN